MRKSLLVSVLVCALACATLSRPASAGDSHTPGDEGCPPAQVCPPPEEGNSATPTGPEVFVVWIDGVPFVIVY